ncbi:MAG: VWA domain-containing protein [Phycisphaerales bacterium]|nr:VWA domain-containing protein [Phycisphaerales bacterium]MCB9855334.1 VWA domain-containing protein [Phycisphaerales bacterium]MCB9862927.1 VWA domain-containing protein [Phycisphaerales bacterium]
MTKLTYLQQLATGLAQLPPDPVTSTAVSVLLYLIVILDKSGSMAASCGTVDRLEAACRATISMIEKRLLAEANDCISIISFNDRAQLVLPFTPCRENQDRIRVAINSINAGGGTELKAPLVLANKIYPPDGHVHIILLSDGHGGNPVAAAEALKQRGAIIDTVGVGNDPSDVAESVMKRIASTVNGKNLYRFLTDADDIDNYFKTEIANRLTKRG